MITFVSTSHLFWEMTWLSATTCLWKATTMTSFQLPVLAMAQIVSYHQLPNGWWAIKVNSMWTTFHSVLLLLSVRAEVSWLPCTPFRVSKTVPQLASGHRPTTPMATSKISGHPTGYHQRTFYLASAKGSIWPPFSPPALGRCTALCTKTWLSWRKKKNSGFWTAWLRKKGFFLEYHEAVSWPIMLASLWHYIYSL